MKLKHYILIAFVTMGFPQAYAQEETPAPPPPAEQPATVAPPKVAPRPKALPPVDSIKGNASGAVSIVSATGSCNNNLKPVGIMSKATNGRNLIARIEVTAAYNGHVSKKNINIDNIAPNETRYIGCSGCMDNPSGQTCTSYKILAAAYK